MRTQSDITAALALATSFLLAACHEGPDAESTKRLAAGRYGGRCRSRPVGRGSPRARGAVSSQRSRLMGFAREVCGPSCWASPMRIPSGPRM